MENPRVERRIQALLDDLESADLSTRESAIIAAHDLLERHRRRVEGLEVDADYYKSALPADLDSVQVTDAEADQLSRGLVALLDQPLVRGQASGALRYSNQPWVLPHLTAMLRDSLSSAGMDARQAVLTLEDVVRRATDRSLTTEERFCVQEVLSVMATAAESPWPNVSEVAIPANELLRTWASSRTDLAP